ncbi:MAG: hypothetical protein R2744_09670 [Bacteroidales bacterium]
MAKECGGKLSGTSGILYLSFFRAATRFFYNLANLRVALGIKSNFEMLYLPDEMFKQKDKEIHLVFRETIPWQTFDRSKPALEWAAWLKQKSYDLESVIK